MLALLLLALAAVDTAGAVLPAFTFTLPLNATVNEQAVILGAQGLLNRKAATLWLYEPVFWTYNASTYWFPPNYLEPVKNFSFKEVGGDFCDLAAATSLFASAGGPVRGTVLYNDTALDATRWLAVTLGALRGALAVTGELVASPAYACLAALPVLADYSQPAALNWTSNVAAYQWGVQQLLPACSNASVYSAGHSYTDVTESVYLGGDPAIDIGLDGAVAKQMFVFNLSPDAVKYPAHAAEFTAIVAALRERGGVDAVPNLWGWAEPEPDMTLATSRGGGSVLCDGAPNLSFWWGVASQPPALPYHATSVALDPHRAYVAWQTNEGDTPKIAAGLQAGAWLDPARGSVPVAWGINPALLDLAPGLLQFYADTATPNDTFFAATAGAGYAYPSQMPPASFHAYVERAAGLIRRLTPTWPPYSFEVDIWDSNVPENVSSYANIAGSAVGAFSMQPEAMEGTNTWLPGGLPLIITNHSLWYPFQQACPPGDPVAAMAAIVQETARSLQAANPGKPAFLLVYGITSETCGVSFFDYIRGVEAVVAAGNSTAGVPPVSVVGMQDLVRLARDAAALP